MPPRTLKILDVIFEYPLPRKNLKNSCELCKSLQIKRIFYMGHEILSMHIHRLQNLGMTLQDCFENKMQEKNHKNVFQSLKAIPLCEKCCKFSLH